MQILREGAKMWCTSNVQMLFMNTYLHISLAKNDIVIVHSDESLLRELAKARYHENSDLPKRVKTRLNS